MNFLDFLILAFTGLFIIQGYQKGFIISLATFIALALGIYIAVNFSNLLDDILLRNLKPSRSWLPILSFTITFIGVVVGILIVAKVMEKIVDVVGIGFLNHLGGALIGLVKGIILVSIVIFIISSFDPKEKWITPEDKSSSLMYHKAMTVFPRLINLAGGKIKFPPHLPG